MAEYSSLKVPELKKLLADKKLPQIGNKADLIARLHDVDKNAKASATAAAPLDQEDEINYTDDEVVPVNTAPAAEPKPADVKQSVQQDKKQQVPAQASAPAQPAAPKPVDKAEEPKAGTLPPEPVQYFLMGLSKTAADVEAQKRADRAKRFGIEEDDEAKRRAARAKRFGIDEAELSSGLDSALSEKSLKRRRGRGRGAGANDDAHSTKRQNLDRRPDHPGRNARGPRPNGSSNRGNVLDDPVERAKAEKRAARFAAA